MDTYLRMSLSDEALCRRRSSTSSSGPPGLSEFVRQTFRDASDKRRKNGNSMIPVLLDETTTHALRIAEQDVEQFLRTLFEIHDEIDLIDADRGFMAVANTTQRSGG